MKAVASRSYSLTGPEIFHNRRKFAYPEGAGFDTSSAVAATALAALSALAALATSPLQAVALLSHISTGGTDESGADQDRRETLLQTTKLQNSTTEFTLL